MTTEWERAELARELCEAYPEVEDVRIDPEIDPRIICVTMKFPDRTKRIWVQWFGPFGWLRI